jgi:hypothetical protein
VFGHLAERGVSVLLSNSDVPSIRKLYASFRMDTIQATRVINCKATRRGPVRELLVHHVIAPVPRAARTKASSSGSTSMRSRKAKPRAAPRAD